MSNNLGNGVRIVISPELKKAFEDITNMQKSLLTPELRQSFSQMATLHKNIITPEFRNALKHMEELRSNFITPEFRRSLNQMTSVQSSLYSELRNSLKHLSNPNVSVINPELRLAINQMADLQKKLIPQETGEKLSEIISNLGGMASLNKILLKNAKIQVGLKGPTIRSTYYRLSQIAQAIDIEPFDINDDGTIVSQTSVLKIEDAQNVINQFVDEQILDKSGELSLEKTVFAAIQSIAVEHPIISRIIIWALIPFLVGIYVNSITSQPSVTINNKTVVYKFVNSVVQSAKPDDRFLKEHRFVSVERLNVRINGTNNSPVIGTLTLGQIVKVIEKKRNWTLIECYNQEDETRLRGWVYTRYIKKFKQR